MWTGIRVKPLYKPDGGMKAFYYKLAAIVLPIVMIKGFLSSLLSNYISYIARAGGDLPPIEIAKRLFIYGVINSVSSLSLFIIYLVTLYLLYRSQDLKKIYKETIVVLLGTLLIGFSSGRVLGQFLNTSYTYGEPDIPYLILYGLTSSLNDVILYFFGGFTAISISYLIHKKT